MNRINVYVSIYSLIAFIIIIERVSRLTLGTLPPYNFIRLHELIQTNLFIPATVVISVLLLGEITHRFTKLHEKGNTFWLILFILGVYFYAAGEGWHEVASFTFNTYCNLHYITGNLCGGLFINDYYAGNIIFFIGGILMNVVLLTFAIKYPMKPMNKKQMTILLTNSMIYAFTWYAYAAFDVVIIGFYAALFLTVLSALFTRKIRYQWRKYPYITYSMLAYGLATLATLLTLFH